MKMRECGLMKKEAVALSLVKGIMILDNEPVLVSDVIERELGIPCSALSGANVANVIFTQFTTLNYSITILFIFSYNHSIV